MQCTTKRRLVQLALVRWHLLVVLGLLVLVLGGQMPDSVAGWLAYRPQAGSGAPVLQRRGRCTAPGQCAPACLWRHLRGTIHLPLLRSGLLGSLWFCSGVVGPAWICLVPVGLWLWQSTGILWPQLRWQPEWRSIHWLGWQSQRLLLVGYLGLAVSAWWQGQALSLAWPELEPTELGPGSGALGLGCVVCGREEPWVEVVPAADGGYTATLCGHFTWSVAGDHPFRTRVLLHGLRGLAVPGSPRRGRRTRDGRTPFVSQEQLARWFGMPQPNISRLERYWLAGDWANLLSLDTAEPLTNELRTRVVTVCAAFPWWGVQRVYHYLQKQGVPVSERQVRQAVEQSGWTALRQELGRRYQVTAESIRPRDEWLVTELLTLVTTLLEKLAAGTGLTPAEQLAVADLQTLAAEVGIVVQPPLQPLPWLLRVERVVFGQWDAVTDGAVRCIYCGSTHVVRKSQQPRLKKYYDEAGDLQTVAVYRYYCRNVACDKGSFTNLPPGLVPYSRYRTTVHLLSVQMYVWGHSTYRRTGTALGVTSMTVYRWVSAWGYELLPVAALFGVVKSSGVVGVDEKYVLVPQNDKPAGKMRRWMYVYLAVDVYTYDLLHIAIYPYNNKDSARTFLLALRAKGYQPKIVITDLRQDYSRVMAQVFAQAQHHECIFHAQQDVQQHFKQVYGAQFAATHPAAVALKGQIYHIFAARTKRTAQKRYEKVRAQRKQCVRETPAAVAIFDSLRVDHHWPTLVNGIESTIIPRTNNAVELVIRRFDQQYQNFCGFDNIASARLFLGVFEKVYRFTPFSQDAQPRIRGKCPLELAGYDISQMPMASLCAGSSFAWPLEPAREEVPKQ
ncbi:MAG: transposase [Chloroflexi bacterium]|nr:transposase [Chloroflexota bacterium]